MQMGQQAIIPFYGPNFPTSSDKETELNNNKEANTNTID